MEQSKAERRLSELVAKASPPPSELALEAIVFGVPVEATRPITTGMDVAFPSGLPLLL